MKTYLWTGLLVTLLACGTKDRIITITTVGVVIARFAKQCIVVTFAVNVVIVGAAKNRIGPVPNSN